MAGLADEVDEVASVATGDGNDDVANDATQDNGENYESSTETVDTESRPRDQLKRGGRDANNDDDSEAAGPGEGQQAPKRLRRENESTIGENPRDEDVRIDVSKCFQRANIGKGTPERVRSEKAKGFRQTATALEEKQKRQITSKADASGSSGQCTEVAQKKNSANANSRTPEQSLRDLKRFLSSLDKYMEKEKLMHVRLKNREAASSQTPTALVRKKWILELNGERIPPSIFDAHGVSFELIVQAFRCLAGNHGMWTGASIKQVLNDAIKKMRYPPNFRITKGKLDLAGGNTLSMSFYVKTSDVAARTLQGWASPERKASSSSSSMETLKASGQSGSTSTSVPSRDANTSRHLLFVSTTSPSFSGTASISRRQEAPDAASNSRLVERSKSSSLQEEDDEEDDEEDEGQTRVLQLVKCEFQKIREKKKELKAAKVNLERLRAELESHNQQCKCLEEKLARAKSTWEAIAAMERAAQNKVQKKEEVLQEVRRASQQKTYKGLQRFFE